jgi:hypothetical protein
MLSALWREDGSVVYNCCWPSPAHSRVRVPWDSWLYFTVSDSRLPFSSPPTTRRATVEVFDPSSTRVSHLLLYICLAYRIGDTESNSPAICCHENVCLPCCENNAYRAVGWQWTPGFDSYIPALRSCLPSVSQQPTVPASRRLPMQWIHMSQ